MTHEYGKEIHSFIAEKIKAVKVACNQAEKAKKPSDVSYYQGKLETYLAVQELLSESFELTTQNYS